MLKNGYDSIIVLWRPNRRRVYMPVIKQRREKLVQEVRQKIESGIYKL